MRVSVVVPTFNGERFVKETLQSVVRQTFEDFEVVVSDDGSSDATIDAVGSLGDDRIRILPDRSHVGAAGNWNRALSAARGEYVKVLAQDDLLRSDNLSVQVAALDANPDVSFASVRRDIIGADGSMLMRDRGLSGLSGVVGIEEASRKVVRSGANLFGEGAAVLFRRTAGRAVGHFDGSLPYTIDVDYWLRLLEWGPMLAIPGTHASFRVSGASWSNSLIRAQGSQFSALIDRISSDPRRRITRSDIAMGKARAVVNGYLRQAFYFRHRNSL